MSDKLSQAIELFKSGMTITQLSKNLKMSHKASVSFIKSVIGDTQYEVMRAENAYRSRQETRKKNLEKEQVNIKRYEQTKNLAGKFYLGFFVRGLEQ